MKNLSNKVVVITGAGSGIGRELAWNLSQQGCRLALTDVNEAGLKETVEKLGLSESQVGYYLVDVSDRKAMEKLAKDVIEKFNQVDIVINNAGISSRDSIEDHDYEAFKKVIDVNMWGVIYGCRVFLPYLKQQKEASLVNISSINGMVPFPLNGPYNISKYAVLGLNETLIMELKDTSVQVLSVHPGGIQTNIVNNGIDQSDETKEAFDKIAMTTPAKAAEAIVKGIKKKQARIFIGADAKFMQLLKRISPDLALFLSSYSINKIMPTGTP